jgi:bifunctional DNase/RNase
MLKMTVSAVGVDSDSGGTVILLQGEDPDDTLAMAIGLSEATSIAVATGEIEMGRPLAHDLLQDLLEHTGTRLQRIEVIDLRSGTYYAELVLELPSGEVVRVDSRPSDAIALALRANAGIFVYEHVLGKEPPEAKELPSPADKEGWKKLLDEMEPEDFGKYKM